MCAVVSHSKIVYKNLLQPFQQTTAFLRRNKQAGEGLIKKQRCYLMAQIAPLFIEFCTKTRKQTFLSLGSISGSAAFLNSLPLT